MSYTQKHVELGRALVSKGSESNWKLGCIAQELWPKGDGPGRPAVIGATAPITAEMDEYATEIGLAGRTLREYRDVVTTCQSHGVREFPGLAWDVIREASRDSEEYPTKKRIKDALNPPPKKYKANRWTVDLFRQHMDRPPTNTGKANLSRDAGEVREAIKNDPEVREAVQQAIAADDDVADALAENPKASMRMGAAVSRKYQEAQDRVHAREQVERATDPQKEHIAATRQLFNLQASLDGAVVHMRAAKAEYRRCMVELGEEDRELAAELLEHGLLAIETTLNDLRGQSVADEAEEWLREEGR